MLLFFSTRFSANLIMDQVYDLVSSAKQRAPSGHSDSSRAFSALDNSSRLAHQEGSSDKLLKTPLPCNILLFMMILLLTLQTIPLFFVFIHSFSKCLLNIYLYIRHLIATGNVAMNRLHKVLFLLKLTFS